MSVFVILMICAIACWLLATAGVGTGPVSIGWAGLVFYGIALLVR